MGRLVVQNELFPGLLVVLIEMWCGVSKQTQAGIGASFWTCGFERNVTLCFEIIQPKIRQLCAASFLKFGPQKGDF